MEEITETDLILLDIAKVWGVLEDRTKEFLATIIVGEEDIDNFDDVMSELYEEMKFVGRYTNVESK